MSQYDDMYSFDEKPKRKRDEDPTTWGDAWKAIGLFVAVVMIFSLVVSFIQRMLYADVMQEYARLTFGSSDLDPTTVSFLENYTTGTGNPVFLILSLLLSMVILIVGLLVTYGVMHIVATKLFNGYGTLRGLIVKANRWTLGFYLVYGLISTVVGTIMIVNMTSQFASVDINSSAAMTEFSQSIMSSLYFIYGLFFVIWLGWNIAMSFVAAKNYKFSTGKGCMSLFMTNIGLLVLFCGISFAMGFAVAGMMTL